METKTCADRVDAEMAETLSDIRKLWEAYPEEVEDLGTLDEYALSLDYVEPEPLCAGYIRYQISWGGPSSEFRFHFTPKGSGYWTHRVEFVFMDWFDSASVTLSGDDEDLMVALWDDWNDCGTIAHLIEQAAA